MVFLKGIRRKDHTFANWSLKSSYSLGSSEISVIPGLGLGDSLVLGKIMVWAGALG